MPVTAPAYGIARVQSAPGVSLEVRSYLDPTADTGSPPVLLLHGLLASAEIFDVPGLPTRSLARYLGGKGHRVFTYDQRGAGSSTTSSWAFGLRESVLTDLVAVIAHVLTVARANTIILGGYSLGGMLSYLLRASLAVPGTSIGGITIRELGPSFSIAAPAHLSPELRPWQTVWKKRSAFLAGLDPNNDGLVERSEFIRVQAILLNRLLGPLLPPGLVDLALWSAARSETMAWVVKMLPLPNLLYARGDLTAVSFRRLIRSRAIDRGPSQILHELAAAIAAGIALPGEQGGETVLLPNHLANAPTFPLLTFSSARDTFVPEPDVRAVHDHVRGGRHVVTEATYGITSGHAGYLFKEGLYPMVYREVEQFIETSGAASSGQ